SDVCSSDLEQRRLVEERQREHAPLRAELGEIARRFASALTFRAQDLRGKAERAKTDERAAREEAKGYRSQANEASKTEGQAEARAAALDRRLAEGTSRQATLILDEILGAAESPEAGVARWATAAKEHEEAGKRIEGEIARL